jgi:L-ribulose-5-phosphate 3-epimerase
MLLGYNTNGLAHHDPLAAIELLAQIGYRSVALSLDHHLLNPFSPNWQQQLRDIRHVLERLGLRSTIETGARYLLNPRAKHEPTLVTANPAERARRIDFLKHAIDVAAELNSDSVALFSGIVHRPGGQELTSDEAIFARLTAGLIELLDYAGGKRAAVQGRGGQGVVLAFEPEPGMFVDTMARFDQLKSHLGGERLKLTLDLGHLHCQGELPIGDYIHHYAGDIANVHIEDMRQGIHEHLMFGEGEMEFPPVFHALRDIGYSGPVHVELSRHSHDGPRAASQAFEYLRPLVNSP